MPSERLPVGGECQCVKCGLFFSSLTAFDFHHRGEKRGRKADLPVVCRDPRKIGMILLERKSGPVWAMPGENPYQTTAGPQGMMVGIWPITPGEANSALEDDAD